MLQGFEWHSPGKGVHWTRMTEKLDSLAEMGVTAIWLPPPAKASSLDSNGYDIYDIWDLGEFQGKGTDERRTKWGTKDEFITL